MRRREFLGVLAGAVAAWPLAARAQQPGTVRRIGVLLSSSETDPEGQSRVAALRQGLQGLGWTEGRNIKIDYRWVAGDPGRARAYAGAVVAWTADVRAAAP